MGLTMNEKQAVTKQLAIGGTEPSNEYKRTSKKEKKKMLDSVIKLTGYNRSYAARVLHRRAKPKVVGRFKRDGVHITLVEDEQAKRKKKQRKRPRKYDKDVLVPLRKIWVICDCICGKRLAPYLPEIVPVLERWEELEINEGVRRKLLTDQPGDRR